VVGKEVSLSIAPQNIHIMVKMKWSKTFSQNT
jgi:hypothetical protein